MHKPINIERSVNNFNQKPIVMSPNQVVPYNQPKPEPENDKKSIESVRTDTKKNIKHSFFLSNLLPNFE